MGWKSTIRISRERAIYLITMRLDRSQSDSMPNEKLSELLCALDYGDDEKLPYYGHNFWICNDENDAENFNTN